jgi:nicotinate-nucleotide adenylyltransferase
MSERAGIFGGSFDPVHVAHLVLAERVREARSLDTVLFIPARRPPHKAGRELEPGRERLHMLRLAIEGNPAFQALPVELEREGPSYTLQTVRQLRERLGAAAELYLVVGGDSLEEIPTWWRADELVREIEIVAVPRPGSPVGVALEGLAGRFGAEWAARTRELAVQVPLMEVSATEVRRRVREGLSIRYLVPEAVREHILSAGLYSD